jgi:hypothetical protein
MVEPERPQMSIWCTRFACWLRLRARARNPYYDNNGFVNAPQWNVMRTLRILLWRITFLRIIHALHMQLRISDSHLTTFVNADLLTSCVILTFTIPMSNFTFHAPTVHTVTKQSSNENVFTTTILLLQLPKHYLNESRIPPPPHPASKKSGQLRVSPMLLLPTAGNYKGRCAGALRFT